MADDDPSRDGDNPSTVRHACSAWLAPLLRRNPRPPRSSVDPTTYLNRSFSRSATRFLLLPIPPSGRILLEELSRVNRKLTLEDSNQATASHRRRSITARRRRTLRDSRSDSYGGSADRVHILASHVERGLAVGGGATQHLPQQDPQCTSLRRDCYAPG